MRSAGSKDKNERLRRQLIVERTWREELQKLSIDQQIEIETLKTERQRVTSYPVG